RSSRANAFVFVSLRENRCTLFKDHVAGSALLRRCVVGNRLARQWGRGNRVACRCPLSAVGDQFPEFTMTVRPQHDRTLSGRPGKRCASVYTIVLLRRRTTAQLSVFSVI